MQQAKLITQDEYAAALRSSLDLRQEGSNRIDLSALAKGTGKSCYYRALERLLVSAIGEQELYRSGRIVKTTLDKALQNELRNWEGPSAERAVAPDQRISVVQQGELIRAILCVEGSAAMIREKLDSFGETPGDYEVREINPDEISRERIILP